MYAKVGLHGHTPTRTQSASVDQISPTYMYVARVYRQTVMLQAVCARTEQSSACNEAALKQRHNNTMTSTLTQVSGRVRATVGHSKYMYLDE